MLAPAVVADVAGLGALRHVAALEAAQRRQPEPNDEARPVAGLRWLTRAMPAQG